MGTIDVKKLDDVKKNQKDKGIRFAILFLILKN